MEASHQPQQPQQEQEPDFEVTKIESTRRFKAGKFSVKKKDETSSKKKI